MKRISITLVACALAVRAAAEPGPERLERFLNAMGGRAAWSEVHAVVVRATHHETTQPGPYANTIWNDFTAPRVRIEAKSSTLDVQRAIDGDKGWRSRNGTEASLTPEQIRDERRWWEANIYRTLHRMAKGDPTLSARAVGDNRLEIWRDDEVRLNWIELNPAGEPVRFGTWDSETGSVFGPLGTAGKVRFPRWGSNAAGTWRYEIVEFVPLKNLPPSVMFSTGGTGQPPPTGAGTLRAYYDAFNRHDAAAVTAYCAEDVKWYSIDGDKQSTDAQSRTQLHDWLANYFKSLPTVRSEVLALDQAGPYLTVRERASWDNKAGKRVAQQAIGVYEVREGLIKRVWYYPSVRE